MNDHSTVRSRELGQRLVKIRENAGYSAARVAELIGHVPSMLSRLENGYRGTSDIILIQYLHECGVRGDRLREMLDFSASLHQEFLVAEPASQLPDEVLSLTLHESAARNIQTYECTWMPGLLQSWSYVAALFNDAGRMAPDQVDAAVQRRRDRQAILHRKNPPWATFYILESVLHMPVGNAQVLHDQLVHLNFACDWKGTTIRVVPMSGASYAGAMGAFRLMDFPSYDPVAIENLMSGMVFIEKPSHIETYRTILNRLDEIALSAAHSKMLIAKLAHGNREEGNNGGNRALGRGRMAHQ